MGMKEPGAGDLNRRVLIRLRADMPAANLGLDSVFTDEKMRWVRIEPVGTAIYTNSVQTDSKITHRITLRYLQGITDAHEVVHGSTIYRVRRSADMNGAHRFTVLEVEELGQALQPGGNIYG